MYLIDPLSDPRWAPFVERHPAACAFHTAGWIRALSITYGYKPFAVTSAAPGSELRDAIPLCRVESWATGRRLVSLPFADHCQPLVSPDAESDFISFLSELARLENYKFFELRPATSMTSTALPERNRSAAYVAHWLDLSPSLETIFNTFHKDSIQRKIRRAERENLRYEEGRSADIINHFYVLMVRTRRRHQLPPQPKEWFYNMAEAMGDSVQFRLAFKDEHVIAAVVTLTHRNSMIYKYGCSDERYHATGCMPFLFWRMIQDAKNRFIPLLDFGRSDLDNPGLVRFKDQWGTQRAELNYFRFPPRDPSSGSRGIAARMAKTAFSILPSRVLELVGRVLYRHIG
ncbi:MAG: lipid II:glycine glycyltransferase FemX [Terriglobales bacterium]